MSIIQFIRILWARRMLPVLTTVATAVGAIIAILVIPPSYEGKTRVMLNTVKPDPVTGEMMPNAAMRTFITTQTELIKDIGVAGQAVDQLGWLSNPEAIRQYNGSGGQDNDLRRAMAQRIIDRTKVDIVPGTNILEISFRAATPDEARSMANALRDAFVESTLNGRRRDAARNADWYTQQAVKERDLLGKADAAKTQYEHEAGIVMQDATTDVETARLRRSGAGMPGLAAPMMARQRRRRSSLRRDATGAARQPDRTGVEDAGTQPPADDPDARPARDPGQGRGRRSSCGQGSGSRPGPRDERRRWRIGCRGAAADHPGDRQPRQDRTPQ